VLGAAVARRAARELELGAGIDSTSVHALLTSRDRGQRLPDGCVLVLDEAGMLGTRQLARVLDHMAAAGGKLVLVGDHRQLPELEAGGTFRALARRPAAIRL
jgi:ATP-dependent exoDNAse (exonuclease V) alpha subunit